MARVYRGRVEVSIEAVHRLHEPASLPTEVKEVLAMFAVSLPNRWRRDPLGSNALPWRIDVCNNAVKT